MEVFLAAFPLEGVRVAVAGEGEAADAKARLFDGSPARLIRIPADRAEEKASYAGARLAFVALEGEAAARAAGAARATGALVNVVDRPELCDFHTPALIDRGAVVGAIATGGAAPVLAAELRSEIEARWPERLGALAEVIATLRDEVRTALPDPAARRAWLRRELIDGPAASLALAGDRAGALAEARGRLGDRADRDIAAGAARPASRPRTSDLEGGSHPDPCRRPGVGGGNRPSQSPPSPDVTPSGSNAAGVSGADVARWSEAGASVVWIGPVAAFAHLGSLAPSDGQA